MQVFEILMIIAAVEPQIVFSFFLFKDVLCQLRWNPRRKCVVNFPLDHYQWLFRVHTTLFFLQQVYCSLCNWIASFTEVLLHCIDQACWRDIIISTWSIRTADLCSVDFPSYLSFFFFCDHRRLFVRQWCYSSNIPFPFHHIVPLFPLSVLDVGEATASALPPTLSLHYSLPYHHSQASSFTSRSHPLLCLCA